jgi:hypothetical protein
MRRPDATSSGYFSSDKFEGSKTREERRCKCGAQPKLSHKMLESSPGYNHPDVSAASGLAPRTRSKAASSAASLIAGVNQPNASLAPCIAGDAGFFTLIEGE